MAVDPGGANFQATRQCRGAGGIRAPYRSAKTERRRLGALHCIVGIVEAQDRQEWPARLLGHQTAERKRVVSEKSETVRVGIGGSRSLKQTQQIINKDKKQS